MMYLENPDWLWPSLTLKLVFILIIAGVATRGKAQTSNVPPVEKAEITEPMQMGNLIPDELWDTPLTLWNAANDRTETITLNDYRGKVIILDFWATWCKSCIANMPRMHQLQDQFEGDVVVLPVTYENPNIVSAFLERTADTGMVALRQSFQSIVADSVIKRTFPNPDGSIPYFAIVANTGVFTGLTIPPQMNERLLTRLVNNEETAIPPLQSAPETPLLERSPRYAANRLNKPFYYSMLSGYMEGFTYPVGHTVDSMNRRVRFYSINQPILRLYSLALSSRFPSEPNRRIMLVDSAKQYEYHHLRNAGYAERKHSYSFEVILPLGAVRDGIRPHLLMQLNSVTGLTGSLIKRIVPCLVIKESHQGKLNTDSGKVMKMKSFVGLLNRQYQKAIPPVINEAAYRGNISLPADFDFTDIEWAKQVLANHGLSLYEEQRELELFVLSDGEYDPQHVPIVLGKYGYVREGQQYE
ncbi:TlpA disulfide reductase family protein [Parapedobacter sp. 10938]|uniref:TlpA disulfide reductase family protein n=1 Tax=Parapedobacter flavus TaxID=3110225 RepID=UPI002DBABF82|nr:TlpA disulfide reductase family protein [Parapedobacter sp. 10938]MEC3881951.1 TlpA disulfide reductase family protein [Parapedobacter sp. 10938]